MTEAKSCLSVLKAYLVFISILFLVSIATGYIYSVQNPGSGEEQLEELKKFFSPIKDLNPLLIMLIIFLNNVAKSFLAMILGIGFGIVPVFFTITNGFILGLIAHTTQQGEGTLVVIAALLPHGILEVPLVLISTAIGLRLGYKLLQIIQGRKIDIKKEFKRAIVFYKNWILPFLFLAAAIETFITPLIILVVRILVVR